MGYENYTSAKMRVIGGPKWDALIRDIGADFAALKEAKSAQDQLADKLLARGLQVIEDLVTPVASLAASRVAIIDGLVTDIESQKALSISLTSDISGIKSDALEALAEIQGGDLSFDGGVF